jgi:hypothetical protein
MASTYSTNLALELIGTGDQAGTWGTTTNTNLGTLIEEAISGYGSAVVSTGGTTIITIPNGASGTARNMVINVTGTGGASTYLEVPNKAKLYVIFNAASGAFTVKPTSGSGVSVPASTKAILYCDGTNVVDAVNYLSSLSLGAALPVASGGTGSTSTTAYAVYAGNSGGTGFSAIAPGASGTILTSNGASALPTYQSTFVGTGTLSDGSTISDGTTAFKIGYLYVPQNAQSSNYTLALTDNGKHVYSTNSGTQTITIPANSSVAFPTGAAITLVNNGTTAITLSAAAVTLYQAGTTNTGNRTLATKGLATLLKVATDTWFVTGSGVS